MFNEVGYIRGSWIVMLVFLDPYIFEGSYFWIADISVLFFDV